MRICVTYSEICTHSEREPVGFWREDYDSAVTGAYQIGEEDRGPYNSDIFILPDDTTHAYVVYMIYSTGDSFGRAHGRIDIIHCTSSEDSADRLAKQITDSKNEYSIKFKDDFGCDISLYNPGAGYFESIDYVGVEAFAIGNGAAKKRYYVN